MYLTKSLFVEFCGSPKLAWWKVHVRAVYKKIRKIETEEQELYMIRIGQAVEQAVKQFLEWKYGTKAVDLMPEFHKDEEEEDDDEFVERVTPDHAIEATIEAIRAGEKLLYQPTFRRKNCLVRADFMVCGDDGVYQLAEVKAKTTVRNEVTDDDEKKNIGKLLPELVADTSFQRYVINHALLDAGLPVLGDVFLRHLNKEYVKDGDLLLSALLESQQVGVVVDLQVVQRGKDTKLTRDDSFISDEEIEKDLALMEKMLPLDEAEFNKGFPFSGAKYLEYFGKDKPFGTIYSVPHANGGAIERLHENNRIQLTELDEIELAYFQGQTGPGEASKFIEKYFDALKQNPIVDHEVLEETLTQLVYPICFYDYESVSVPIPFLDKTFPYQQVVVQYSLHKLYEDGALHHFGGLLVDSGEYKVTEITLPDHDNKVTFESEKLVSGPYEKLLEEFLKDIGDDLHTSSFIVWHEPFENTRNKEIATLFPTLQDYLQINTQTYDLKRIFSERIYFDLGCKGSASIKKVLPVLVPEMSYEHMRIGRGDIAMQTLHKLLAGEIPEQEKMQVIHDLLLYCGQDSLAMVKIFQALKNT